MRGHVRDGDGALMVAAALPERGKGAAYEAQRHQQIRLPDCGRLPDPAKGLMMNEAIPGRRASPPPPFDPELADAVATINQQIPPTLTADLIPNLREGMQAMRTSDDQVTRDGAFTTRTRTVPGPAGQPDVTLLICRPAGVQALTGAVYHIHGGGMVFGDRQGNELPPFLDIAHALGLVLVSVEYRLAPENPHPVPVEDCYAGLVWTAAHAAELGIDPARMVVAGVSAGGGLAAATALAARDRNGPALAGQMLLSPMLDDRNSTYSAAQMDGLGFWDRGSNLMGWTALLGERRGGPDVPAYAAPARADDLAGLPPALLDVGSAETFRDEVANYALRIWQAGGDAELHVWPGGFHGFYLLAPGATVSRRAVRQWREWLARRLTATSDDSATGPLESSSAGGLRDAAASAARLA
jgi:acetyl esterase/lipase